MISTISKIKLFNYKGIPVTFNIFILVIAIFFEINIVVALLISMLLHELAHASVALERGYKVYKVHLDIIFGYASMSSNLKPKDDISITLAGPLINLALSVIFFACVFISVAIGIESGIIFDFFISMVFVNVILFITNMLPITSLDGGVILESFLELKSVKNYKKIASVISVITCIICIILCLIFGIYLIPLLLLYMIYVSYKKYKA